MPSWVEHEERFILLRPCIQRYMNCSECQTEFSTVGPQRILSRLTNAQIHGQTRVFAFALKGRYYSGRIYISLVRMVKVTGSRLSPRDEHEAYDGTTSIILTYFKNDVCRICVPWFSSKDL